MLVIEDKAVVNTPTGEMTLHTFRPVTSGDSSEGLNSVCIW